MVWYYLCRADECNKLKLNSRVITLASICYKEAIETTWLQHGIRSRRIYDLYRCISNDWCQCNWTSNKKSVKIWIPIKLCFITNRTHFTTSVHLNVDCPMGCIHDMKWWKKTNVSNVSSEYEWQMISTQPCFKRLKSTGPYR